MKFKGKLQNRWMGPYEIDTIYANGVVKLRIIDKERYSLMENRYRLKLYRKLLSKEQFTSNLQNHMMLEMVELCSTTSPC